MGDYLEALPGMTGFTGAPYNSMNDLGMLFDIDPELQWADGETQLFSVDTCEILLE
jgi:hypothetical protein